MSELGPHNPEESHQDAYDTFYELGNTVSRWRYRTENIALQIDGYSPYSLQDERAEERRRDVEQQLLGYESEAALGALEGYATHLDALGWDLDSGNIQGFLIFNGSLAILESFHDASGADRTRFWRYYFDKSASKIRVHITDEPEEGEFFKPKSPAVQEEADLGLNDVALTDEQVKAFLFAMGVAKDAIKEYYQLGGNGIVDES